MFGHKDTFSGTPYPCKKHYYMPRHQDNVTRNHRVFHKIERKHSMCIVLKNGHVNFRKIHRFVLSPFYTFHNKLKMILMKINYISRMQS